MINTFKRIWQFSSNRHKNIVNALIFSFLRSVFGVTQLFAILITIGVILGTQDAKQGIITIVILTLICILGNFLTSYFEQKNTMQTGFYMVSDKRISIGNILKKLPLGFFNKSSRNEITALLTTSLQGVETASVMVMVGIISGLFNALAIFIFMTVYNYKIGLIAGAGMVAYLFVVSLQIRISKKNASPLQRAQTNLSESTLSFLQGIKVTKAYSFKNGDKTLIDSVNNSCNENIKLTKKSMPSQLLAGLTIAVFEGLILFFSVYFYFVTKEISLLNVIVLLIFSFMVYASISQAGSMLSMIGLLESGISSTEIVDNAHQLETYAPIQQPKSNDIVFNNVNFSYGNNEVLKDITTHIKENTLTAIIGPSGSGKTTLLKLIPRFNDTSSGTITIGGADIKNIDYKQLMQMVSIVFQQVYLFEDTILNNIRFAKPDATLEEVRQASKLAQCDDFIMSLKDGYDTIVEEGGNNLSGGEKQRISIARAILKDSPIILLDEATSAQDLENERLILKAINELIKNKTVIMIAHRLKTIEKADHIICIKNGKIVQEGTPQQLMSEQGLYSDFINSKNIAKGWTISN